MNSLALLERAGLAAAQQEDPETALRTLLAPLHSSLGKRGAEVHLPVGEAQFFVSGAFMVSPDAQWHMLIASQGFPAEQSRLMIPIAGGHPGRVRATRIPIHLPDTEVEGAFRQYLKTARMGSSIYVPMLWQGRFLGQIVIAARARNSLLEEDFLTMRAAAPLAAALWTSTGGDAWLQDNYPPESGFRVPLDGLT